MTGIMKKSARSAACYVGIAILAGSLVAFAQEQQNLSSQPQPAAPAPGWHAFSSPPLTQAADPPDQSDSADPSQSKVRSIPARLVIQRGTFITVRTDQMLSSKRNQAGDAFTATLAKPLVVEGLVVAQRGQTVGGTVVEARKSGRVKGVAQLAVRLTDLTMVDGEQMPVQTQLIGIRAPTSRGRDAGAVVATTALGAAVGGAATGGVGAAVGAGAGAIVGTVGVLLTRGHAVVIYPESTLTFRLEVPVAVSTARAPGAFRNVEEDAYAQPPEARNLAPAPRGACASYGCPPPSYYSYPYYSYPNYYGFGWPAYYPYYYGPTFYFGRGGFYGFGGYRGFRGYRR